jgi:hypothetical protein
MCMIHRNFQSFNLISSVTTEQNKTCSQFSTRFDSEPWFVDHIEWFSRLHSAKSILKPNLSLELNLPSLFICITYHASHSRVKSCGFKETYYAGKLLHAIFKINFFGILYAPFELYSVVAKIVDHIRLFRTYQCSFKFLAEYVFRFSLSYCRFWDHCFQGVALYRRRLSWSGFFFYVLWRETCVFVGRSRI